MLGSTLSAELHLPSPSVSLPVEWRQIPNTQEQEQRVVASETCSAAGQDNQT